MTSLKFIRSQPQLQWLNLSYSCWAAGWCHLRCPLRVWEAARAECLPVAKIRPSWGTPHSHTQSDRQWLGRWHTGSPFLLPQSEDLGVEAGYQMDFQLVEKVAIYTTVRNCHLFLSQAAMFSSRMCHICTHSYLTLLSLSSQERRFQIIRTSMPSGKLQSVTLELCA